jgi:hypothetical protein
MSWNADDTDETDLHRFDWVFLFGITTLLPSGLRGYLFQKLELYQ